MNSTDDHFQKIWILSVVSFLIAALTGFLYRVGMLYSLPSSLDLVNIRHAHSHLMFFNWISPPIMIWIASNLAKHANTPVNHKKYKTCLYTMIMLGFLAYPFFLIFGYGSVTVGSADLPVAAILSGLVMFTWYWFGLLYFQDRNQTKNTLSLSIFDGALVALFISSMGAWGVSVFQFSGIHNPLYSSALTHFFLAVFTEGWAVLGILGVIWSQFHDPEVPFNSGWLWKPILLGSMLIFPFSLTQSLITPLMLYSAKAGLLLIVISLSLHLYLLLSNKLHGFVWKTILFLIGTKIVFQIIAILPIELWPGVHGIRILYLHLLLLGIVTITLFKSFQTEEQHTPVRLFTATVLLVLASLVLISGYVPLWLIPPQPYHWVMYIAFLPIISAGWILIKMINAESYD